MDRFGQVVRDAQVGLRLTAEQRAKLERLAKATGGSLSAVMGTLIDQATVRPVVTLDVEPQVRLQSNLINPNESAGSVYETAGAFAS